jgi:PKD repeat protein
MKTINRSPRKCITFIFMIISLMTSSTLKSQNWSTFNGGNQKNGCTGLSGPENISSSYWTVTSSTNTVWGNAVYTFGDKFVSSRGSVSPYTFLVEMRKLTDGSLIWSKSISEVARLYAVGFTEDAVYAADYQDTISILYALSVDSGNIKWSIPTKMFPGNTGICFAPDGDPIIFGKRLDRRTGIPVWTYDYMIPIVPDGGFVVHGDTYYHWTGSAITPKRLIAVDIVTGLLKYESDDLPGDGDQENDLIVAPNGTIYIARDGGALHAFSDNGIGFQELWSASPAVFPKSFGPGNTIYCAKTNDGSFSGTLMRISAQNGAVIDSVPGTLAAYVSVDADSTVYVNNGEGPNGRLTAFTHDLQSTKWTMGLPFSTYLGAPIGKEGVLVAVGEGSEIMAYKPTISRKPLADFRSSGRDIQQQQPISFFDQSSYLPTSWYWSFPGGNPSTSNQQNPSGITYAQTGMYPVKLVASNAFGSDSVVKTSYVVVSPLNGTNDKSSMNSFMINQNHPNPFTTSTTITCQTKDISIPTNLTVYDSYGKEVAILINEILPPGFHQVPFHADALPPGMYFYTLRTGHQSSTKKMTIIR